MRKEHVKVVFEYCNFIGLDTSCDQPLLKYLQAQLKIQKRITSQTLWYI